MPRLLSVILLTFICGNALAQSWEFGGRLGGAGYMGDLNTNNPIKISGISAGGFIKYNFNPYFSAKVGYTYGNISAADSLSSNQQFRERNLSFSTNLHEVGITGEFNFLDYVPSISKNVFTPFIFAGVAMVNYNPTAIYQGNIYSLRPLTTEGQSAPYKNYALAVPYGAGIKYNISGRLNLIADIGYRYVRTDYLDDVSGNYPNPVSLPVNLARALSDRSGERTGVYIGTVDTQRGDNRSLDTYFFVGLSLSYTFITQKCYY
jgi:hypothetical protein